MPRFSENPNRSSSSIHRRQQTGEAIRPEAPGQGPVQSLEDRRDPQRNTSHELILVDLVEDRVRHGDGALVGHVENAEIRVLAFELPAKLLEALPDQGRMQMVEGVESDDIEDYQ